MGLGLGLYLGNVAAHAAAGPTAKPSGRVFGFSADSITPQTDNTALSSWTDDVAGLTISQTGSLRPVYRTSRTNSLPAVQFSGANVFPINRATAVINAMNHYNDATGVTLCWVFANVDPATTSYHSFWSPNTFDGGRSLILSGDLDGTINTGRSGLTTTGLRIVIVRNVNIATAGQSGHFFHNMNGFSSGSLNPGASDNWMLGAVDSTGSSGFKGDLMAFDGYPSMTNAQIAQYVKWACDKFAVAYPWAGLTHFDVFDGDSITFGTGGTDVQHCYPTLLMNAKSKPFGGYMNLAIAGQAVTAMTNSIAMNYTGLAAQLGIPLLITAMEYYNLPETNAASFKAFTAALKSADSTCKILAMDSTDNAAVAGNAVHDNRASFNTALAGDTNINWLAPLHNDTSVGIEGACPDTVGGGTYFADDRHPNDAGYTAIKNFLSSYWDTAHASF